jgi:hypothetical protein
MKDTPYYAAFLRAVILGILSGVSAFLATWSTTNDAKTIGIAAAVAFLAPLIARFGGEGTYDTNRDAKITAAKATKQDLPLQPSDVGYSAITMPAPQ